MCVLPKHNLHRRALASLLAAAQGPDEKRGEEPVFPPVAGEDKVIEGWVLQPEGPAFEGLRGTGAKADGDAGIFLYAPGLAGGLARSKVDLAFVSEEEDGHRPRAPPLPVGGKEQPQAALHGVQVGRRAHASHLAGISASACGLRRKSPLG